MRGTRGRLVVACLAVVGAAIAVAGGSAADNRKGTALFAAVPGPGSVTYGEYIAYSASLDNESKATFTQTTFRQTRPVATWEVDGQEVKYPAGDPVDASCDWSIDTKGDTDAKNDELVCFFGQLRPEDDPQEVTIVWPAPTIPSPTGCAACLSTEAYWLIKERRSTNENEQIPPVPDLETAELLAGEGSEETLRAGGYEREPCTAGGSSLSTNQDIDADDNPVTSSFCLPDFEKNDIDLGLATMIIEDADNHGATVCIAKLGTDCADNDPAEFDKPYVSHEFRVAAEALENGYKIETVSHNDDELPMCDADDPDNPNHNGCVFSITPPKGPEKIWVIVATSPTNGPWDW